MIASFKTIDKPAIIETVEKGSRFIGHAFNVDNEEAALAHLAEIRQLHAKATHNCWAWQMGMANQFTRQSDDGEPSGTAGMPMLDYLRKEDLKNVLVIVTRYYGGTLLGTGGLVRAYGHAAKEACIAARIVEKFLYQKFAITVPYHLGGKLEHELRTGGHIIANADYADQITFTVLTEMPNADNLAKHITNITASTAQIIRTETPYLERP
ncbi:MAG: YigZ family protein [Defluviitaleaceae bacterium]|nr:YigZ family protein [Defluviitaleaceae bacterium]